MITPVQSFNRTSSPNFINDTKTIVMKHLLTIGLLLTSMIALAHNPYYLPSTDEYHLKNDEKVVGELMKIENHYVYFLQEMYTVKKVPLSHLDSDSKKQVLLALDVDTMSSNQIASNAPPTKSSTWWAIGIATATLISMILAVIMFKTRARLYKM